MNSAFLSCRHLIFPFGFDSVPPTSTPVPSPSVLLISPLDNCRGCFSPRPPLEFAPCGAGPKSTLIPLLFSLIIYSGAERKSCHDLFLQNPLLVKCPIAFPVLSVSPLSCRFMFRAPAISFFSFFKIHDAVLLLSPPPERILRTASIQGRRLLPRGRGSTTFFFSQADEPLNQSDAQEIRILGNIYCSTYFSPQIAYPLLPTSWAW